MGGRARLTLERCCNGTTPALYRLAKAAALLGGVYALCRRIAI
jgi:hypothetical protein